MPRNDWWAVELVADWASRDPNGYHRLCWTHHLGYAEPYEPTERFGEDAIHPSRRMLFDDLLSFLRKRDVDPTNRIRSVFEVGCSLGYLLHHMETNLFPSADRPAGIDIDRYAIREGTKYLQSVGSKAKLSFADMGSMEAALGDETFDLMLCAGTLMYLTLDQATDVVRTMLQHTSDYLVLAGLAHPDKDNKELHGAAVREHDRSFIHNLDAMVVNAGGSILCRRWEEEREVQGIPSIPFCHTRTITTVTKWSLATLQRIVYRGRARMVTINEQTIIIVTTHR